jgi:hypothetical protein
MIAVLVCQRMIGSAFAGLLGCRRRAGSVKTERDLQPRVNGTGKNPERSLEHIVDYVWQRIDRRMGQDRIRQIVSEVAQEFEDAAVQAFVPVLVRRFSLERVREELNLSQGDRRTESVS